MFVVEKRYVVYVMTTSILVIVVGIASLRPQTHLIKIKIWVNAILVESIVGQ
tara:strand:+ start:477 stop:632 length:156 start_codon:yes stop_codon:yes gene_type:complete